MQQFSDHALFMDSMITLPQTSKDSPTSCGIILFLFMMIAKR